MQSKIFNRNVLAGFLWSLTTLIPEFFNQNIILINSILIVLSSFLILRNDTLYIPNKYYLFIILFTIYLIINIYSLIYNDIINFSFILNFFFIFYVILTIIFLLNNIDNFKNFLIGLSIGSSLTLVYYINQIDLSLLYNTNYRFTTSMNANSIATSILFLLVIFLEFYFNLVRKKNIKILLIVLITSSITIILFTKSRTSIILAILSILYYFFSKKNIFLLAFGMLVIMNIVDFDKLTSFFRADFENEYELESFNSLSGRIYIWDKAVELINENPSIGVGSEKAFVNLDGTKLHSHNAILQFLMEGGLLGTVPIIIIIFINFKSLFFRKVTFNNFIKLIYILGFIRMMTENKFFNYGTIGSLIFLISIIILSATKEDNQLSL